MIQISFSIWRFVIINHFIFESDCIKLQSVQQHFIMKNMCLKTFCVHFGFCLELSLDHWARQRNHGIARLKGTFIRSRNEEELKSLLMKVEEESEKAGLKLSIQKWRSWHLVPSLHGKEMGKSGNSDRFYFLGLQNHCRWWLQPWN